MYLDSVKIAIEEDSIAYWQRLNKDIKFNVYNLSMADIDYKKKKR